MPSYKAPLDDMRFVLNEVLQVGQLSRIAEFSQVDAATINQFLEETARLAENVLAPLNAVGDREGCVYDRDAKTVKTPKGFKEAYAQFCQAGLTGFACDPKYGGLGMPQVVNTALSEMFCSANLAFGMYPGLTHGAYNALHEYGTDQQKDTYLPKLVSGEWAGTMCLTEPQCGTDLGLIKTKAVKQPDGSYALTGSKIFISSGEQDLTSNICHLVLAKIEDPSTPVGIKGISLFIVPKFLPDTNARNPVSCGRIEEKMGIHGNSTCELNFDGAKGWLVGEANKGMKAMFVMMNEARLGVGLQGLGLSEVAYQNGLAYALDRKQGQPIDQKMAEETVLREAVPIITHPDVRRELLSIKSVVEGERMLAYWLSMQLDISQKDPDEAARKRAKQILDLLIPVMKAHFTDNAVENTNSAIQVFGGHGYIKEHGMEQFNRDARITRLYEGTNGIQGLDLIGRKVLQLNLLPPYMKQLRADLLAAQKAGVSICLLWPVAKAMLKLQCITHMLRLKALAGKLRRSMSFMRDAAGISTDYYKLLSLVAIGHMWIRMAETATQRLAANPEGRDFYETKIKTCRFYMKKMMPQARALTRSIWNGSGVLMEIPADKFAHTQTTIGTK
jgi:alkylation response protein AidB-like acyl-CoA dehydrogenase